MKNLITTRILFRIMSILFFVIAIGLSFVNKDVAYLFVSASLSCMIVYYQNDINVDIMESDIIAPKLCEIQDNLNVLKNYSSDSNIDNLQYDFEKYYKKVITSLEKLYDLKKDIDEIENIRRKTSKMLKSVSKDLENIETLTNKIILLSDTDKIKEKIALFLEVNSLVKEMKILEMQSKLRKYIMKMDPRYYDIKLQRKHFIHFLKTKCSESELEIYKEELKKKHSVKVKVIERRMRRNNEEQVVYVKGLTKKKH